MLASWLDVMGCAQRPKDTKLLKCTWGLVVVDYLQGTKQGADFRRTSPFSGDERTEIRPVSSVTSRLLSQVQFLLGVGLCPICTSYEEY